MTPLEVTLQGIAEVLAGAHWCLIGGAAAILHGADVPLADVDVLAGGPEALRAALGRAGIPLTPDGGTARFRVHGF